MQMNKLPDIPKRDGKELRFAGLMPTGVEEENKMIIEGRALVFNQKTCLFKWDGDEYYETIDARALDEANMSDVVFRYNHSADMFVMARTRGGSLELIKDNEGLLIRASLFDIAQARDLYTLIKAGSVDKMSFAFTIREESYDPDTRTFTIQKIDRMYDVAAVDLPAYDATSLTARKVLDLDSERIRRLERSQLRQKLLARTYL